VKYLKKIWQKGLKKFEAGLYNWPPLTRDTCAERVAANMMAKKIIALIRHRMARLVTVSGLK
jgi:hypothetical protein